MQCIGIVVLHIDDAWGSAFAQDTSIFAEQMGVEIAVSSKFYCGDAGWIDAGVQRTKDSKARIILLLIFDSDVPAFLESAERHGILDSGYVIISGGGFELSAMVNQVPDSD